MYVQHTSTHSLYESSWLNFNVLPVFCAGASEQLRHANFYGLGVTTLFEKLVPIHIHYCALQVGCLAARLQATNHIIKDNTLW